MNIATCIFILALTAASVLPSPSRQTCSLELPRNSLSVGTSYTDAYHARAPILGVGRPQENGTRAPDTASVSLGSFVEPGLQRVKQNPGLLAADACPQKPFPYSPCMSDVLGSRLIYPQESWRENPVFPGNAFPFRPKFSKNSVESVNSNRYFTHKCELCPETSIPSHLRMDAPNPASPAAADAVPRTSPPDASHNPSLVSTAYSPVAVPAAASPTGAATASASEDLTVFSHGSEDFFFSNDQLASLISDAQSKPLDVADRLQRRLDEMQANRHDVIYFVAKGTNLSDLVIKLKNGLTAHMEEFLRRLLHSPIKGLADCVKTLFIEERGIVRLMSTIEFAVEAKALPKKPEVLAISFPLPVATPAAFARQLFRFGISTFDPTQLNAGVEKCVLSAEFIKLFAPCLSVYSIPRTLRKNPVIETHAILAGMLSESTAPKLALFAATRTEDFLIILVSDPAHLVTQPLVTDLSPVNKFVQCPILPAPRDNHAYFLCADLHFPGRSIETTAPDQLTKRYKSILSARGLPTPIHAVPVGHTVLRVHFETAIERNAITSYRATPSEKVGVIIIDGLGPLIMLTQSAWSAQSQAYYKTRAATKAKPPAVPIQSSKRVRNNGSMEE